MSNSIVFIFIDILFSVFALLKQRLQFFGHCFREILPPSGDMWYMQIFSPPRVIYFINCLYSNFCAPKVF